METLSSLISESTSLSEFSFGLSDLGSLLKHILPRLPLGALADFYIDFSDSSSSSLIIRFLSMAATTDFADLPRWPLPLTDCSSELS